MLEESLWMVQKEQEKGEYTSEPPIAKIGRRLRRYEEEHILKT